tara:strand:+ start:1889 stop:3721 length:1833 start_codon:yes stop_codon:yes gene_type:complete
MAITKAFLERLRERVSLSEIIGKRIKIQRAGREFKACCPFHGEKTPSFTINDQKGFYHCFGCGAHGDALGFLMQHDNLAFIDAVEQLSAMAGLEVPKATPQERRKHEREKDLYAYLEAACKWFEEQLFLPQNFEALDYLKKRGFTESQIREFRIGFAPENRDLFVQAMVKEKLAMQELDKLGLVRAHKSGSGHYAFFRGRVIFPVLGKRGRVVAFGGRILPQYDVQEGNYKPPKYLNSPDHDLFHKGELLYNFTKARQAAADNKPIIITEGYTDVIALSKAGFEGAVAPLGTALTENQIELGWRIAPYDDKTLYLCFDGDNAGRRAAFRALERILPMLGPDKTARFVFLPEGQDPDSLIKEKGTTAFNDLIKNAMSFHDVMWLMETEGRIIDTPEAKAGLKDRLDAHIEKITDRNVQKYYFRAMSDKMFKAFSNYNKKNNKSYKNKNFIERQKISSALTPKEKLRLDMLLKCFVNHPFLFEERPDLIFELTTDQDDYLKMIAELQESGLEHIDNVEGLRAVLKEKGFGSILDRLDGSSISLHTPFAQIETPRDEVIEAVDDIVRIMRKEGMLLDLRNFAKDQNLLSAENQNSGQRLQKIGQLVLDNEDMS